MSPQWHAASPPQERPDDPATAHAEPRWLKGNLHTHSLRSDGNDYPEMIVDWYARHGYQFLALSDLTPIVRHLGLPGPVSPLAVKPPLRILAVIAGPTTTAFAALDSDAEWTRLSTALSRLVQAGKVELELLKPPMNFEGMEPRLDPIPALGEHSRAILAELGYAAAEIDGLAAAKAI